MGTVNVGPAIGDAWTIGPLWLVMTLAFEFVGGHYLFGTSWEALLADYNIFAGRLWIIVLIATWIAPAVSYYAAQNRESSRHISFTGAGDWTGS